MNCKFFKLKWWNNGFLKVGWKIVIRPWFYVQGKRQNTGSKIFLALSQCPPVSKIIKTKRHSYHEVSNANFRKISCMWLNWFYIEKKEKYVSPKACMGMAQLMIWRSIMWKNWSWIGKSKAYSLKGCPRMLKILFSQ